LELAVPQVVLVTAGLVVAAEDFPEEHQVERQLKQIQVV
jgi:hypothetical protein